MADISHPAPFVGRPLPRFEDQRLLTGQGRYTDDLPQAGSGVAQFVRSPHAHAEIAGIDTAAARAAAGVLAVLTAQDYRADGHAAIRHVPNPADAVDVSLPAFGQRGGLVRDTAMWPLADGRVRFVGEPVVMVVAATLAQARDAAELVAVDYTVLDAVTGAAEAMQPDAPLLWPDIADNICLDETLGDPDAVAAALAGAHLVVERRFVNQRIVNCQMEPRIVVGDYDPVPQRYTLHCASQGVARQRFVLATALGTAPANVRVVTRDVGGGFGPRSFLESEGLLACWAARRVGRPVRWRSDRSEAFLSDFQARDLATTAALGFDRDGRITAIRIELLGNVGAHTVAFVPLANGSRLVSTVYQVPAACVHVRGVLTNTPSTVAFRGAGRPEATHTIERLLDIAAPRLGIDRVELRRRNLVPRDAMPWRNPMGITYDCGTFERNMDAALRRADWGGFAGRRADSASRGQRRGIAVANYVETPVGAPRERVECTVLPDGSVELLSGTQSTGQGHETSFAQVVADALGVHPADIRLVTGDTDRVEVGGGSHSARSMRLAGALMVEAAASVMAQARALAAELLAVPVDTVTFIDGVFGASGTNRTLRIGEIARARPDAAMTARADLNGRIPAFPTGCAVCEVEIDPETGVMAILRYTTVDDVGRAINPLIVEGQTYGGIVQGLGQALCEAACWDPASGQALTGSFMDYAMPRADMFPGFDISLAEDPTHGTPLGVKGGGEGGTVPALAVLTNAIVDALAADGVEDIAMPATSARIWAALQAASR